MELTLFDINPAMCDAWKEEFYGYKNVSIQLIELEELSHHDVLITAGNSFGIMNGGIDLAVREMMGIEIQDKVQWTIARLYNGQLPVGNAICIESDYPRFPFLIYTPTMKFPEIISEDNVAISFRAALNKIPKGYANAKVACCGLGALTGEVPPKRVAARMREVLK